MGREQQARGRGHSQGARGNRYGRGGASRYQNSSPRTSLPIVKQLELKFTPHIQGKPQVATYATVKDAVIQFVQKTFKDGNDIAQSLKDGKVYNLSKEELERDLHSNGCDQSNFGTGRLRHQVSRGATPFL